MDTENIIEENYDESLIKCDRLSKIVPSLFYNVRLLQRLDKQFEQDATLKELEELLLVLHDLLDIKEDKVAYVNLYRDRFLKILTILGHFIIELPKQKALDSPKNEKLLIIINRFMGDQKIILEIIEE